MHHRLEMIAKAIKLQDSHTPVEQDLLLAFIEHQIKLIREGK